MPVSAKYLVFQLASLGFVLAALAFLSRNRTGRAWLGSSVAVALAAAAGIPLLARDGFELADYAAHVLFVYFPLWLAASAVLLRRKRRAVALLSAVGAAAVWMVAADAFFIEPHWLEVSHYRVASPKLKRPVRVVLLADLQAERFTAYEQQVLRRALEEKPDLLLFAGDYNQASTHDGRREFRKQLNNFLRQLEMKVPLGVFAVRGNVDGDLWTRQFEGLPVKAVEWSESFDLGPLCLTCLSWPGSARRDLELSGPASDRFHLVLGHSPDYALSAISADLCLAGHTHGGQVRLPWLGPIATLSHVPRRLAAGLNERPGGGWMLVSRGIGMEREAAPRLRFLCRPELVVIDLLPQ